jgi:hypothetical protein
MSGYGFGGLRWWGSGTGINDLDPGPRAPAGPALLRLFGDPAVVVQAVLGLERPDPIEVVGGKGVNPSSTVVFTSPTTRKKPRLRSAKAPLRAEFADSTTCRRAMLIRQAVVPNVIDCHHGSSTGIAVRIPEQQHAASVSTNGAVRDRRIVLGNERLRNSPEQNGHFHRVAPSASGPACRVNSQRARLLNLAS